MKEPKNFVDPNWQEKYQSLIATPAEAVRQIKPGQRIFIGTGCAQPQLLVRALAARSRERTDTEIVHLLTFGDAPYAEKELTEHFRVNSFFIAENVREIIQQGFGDYTPIFLSEIPNLFSTGRLPLDVALIQVTPPDERGMCSLGISVDIVKSAAENARLVIAQVNPLMPRTLGDSFLHVHDFDVLAPAEEPLFEITAPQPTEVTRKIGMGVGVQFRDEPHPAGAELFDPRRIAGGIDSHPSIATGLAKLDQEVSLAASDLDDILASKVVSFDEPGNQVALKGAKTRREGLLLLVAAGVVLNAGIKDDVGNEAARRAETQGQVPPGILRSRPAVVQHHAAMYGNGPAIVKNVHPGRSAIGARLLHGSVILGRRWALA